jgi:hypothetical protein
MFRKITVLSRRAAIALVVALIAAQAASAARADGGWSDHDDGPWHRHHGRHLDRVPVYRFSPGYVRPFVVVPAPRYVYVPPPVAVYLLPPVPLRHPRPVAARPVSPVYQDSGGYYCRDYQATIVINGRLRVGHGTACLERDGVWRLIG